MDPRTLNWEPARASSEVEAGMVAGCVRVRVGESV
jgi:hypothetical protein